MYHMFLLSIIRVRPSPTIFASTQPNYLHIYRISCKITKKERRERSLPCYDSHGLIQHVKRIYNNNNNNNHTAVSRGDIPKFSALNLVNVTMCQHYPSALEDLTAIEECLIA